MPVLLSFLCRVEALLTIVGEAQSDMQQGHSQGRDTTPRTRDQEVAAFEVDELKREINNRQQENLKFL